MSSKACTPDNVIAKLILFNEWNGHDPEPGLLDMIDDAGKAAYASGHAELGANRFDESFPSQKSQNDVEVLKRLNPQTLLFADGLKIVKRLLFDHNDPSSYFGEQTLKPVNEFITAHFEKYNRDLEAGRAQYFSGIRQVFANLEGTIPEGRQKAFQEWRKFYEGGGELYSLISNPDATTTMMGNLASNTIKSSPNVILGNVLEATIKLPSLYPKTCIPALAKLVGEGSLFKEIPELKNKGAYGLHYAGEAKRPVAPISRIRAIFDFWDGLIGVTDTPLKNLSYYAGEMDAPGSGLVGVEKVAFTRRFGNLPPVYYSQGSREAYRLMSYTINTYKMYANMWRDAFAGNIQPLVTYHALMGIFGGLTATVPGGVIGQGIIQSVIPGAKEFFDENRTHLTKLAQPGFVSLGVVYSIGDTVKDKIAGKFSSGAEALRDGDYTKGILDLGEAYLNGLRFTNHFLGNAQVAKIVSTARKAAEGEIELEDIPMEMVPALKMDE